MTDLDYFALIYFIPPQNQINISLQSILGKNGMGSKCIFGENYQIMAICSSGMVYYIDVEYEVQWICRMNIFSDMQKEEPNTVT